MPTWIKEDFKPDDRSYVIIGKTGAPREFVDDNCDHFMSYWLDLKKRKLEKGKKESWQTTFQNWMKRAWRGKCGREWEENRHRRQKYYGEPKGDLFDRTFDKLSGNLTEAQKPKEKQPIASDRKYRLPEPPKPGPPMSSTDAFAELDKILGVK